MAHVYLHHRIEAAPRLWRDVAEGLRHAGGARIVPEGGALLGIWRSQIGRPRDELTAITVWPDETTARRHAGLLAEGQAGVVRAAAEPMAATLRPTVPLPAERQGNYAFRWFATPAANWDEFLSLCAAAWPGFEAAYDSQVIGLWRLLDAAEEDPVRSVMLTRRPDLAAWERSKIPQGDAEVAVRAKLSRRYDLCDWTVVYTTTLLTAVDREDRERWT
ncbi:MAG: hypothetical protein ACK4QW_09235 [Alphaproteobacteria bacterium]